MTRSPSTFSALVLAGLAATGLLVTGCASEPKGDRADPITSRTAKDAAPRPTEEESPPLGKPRAKVAPSTVTLEKRTDSLLKDNTPH